MGPLHEVFPLHVGSIMKLSRCFSVPSPHRINVFTSNNPLFRNRTVSLHHFNVRNHSVWRQKRIITPVLHRQCTFTHKWNIGIHNRLYLGIYRRSFVEDPKRSKKKKKSPLSTPKASDPPEGDRDAEPDLQHIPG